MAVLQAVEMAEAINQLGGLLSRNKLIDDASYHTVKAVSGRLKSKKRKKTWRYEITPTTPITFSRVPDQTLEYIIPKIYTKISVDDNSPHYFNQLVSALEIWSVTGKPISRWHVDLANKNKDGAYQEGPLFHLQFGGHWPTAQNREIDMPISIPRWAYPPMDLILMCEVVVANFFPNKWQQLRKLSGWNMSIREAEKLCHKVFFQKMKEINSSGGNITLLHAMWADKWTTAKET